MYIKIYVVYTRNLYIKSCGLFFQVCASFIIEDETANQIAEALQQVKDWCSSWTPKVFMSDNCAAETKALHLVFPGEWGGTIASVRKKI